MQIGEGIAIKLPILQTWQSLGQYASLKKFLGVERISDRGWKMGLRLFIFYEWKGFHLVGCLRDIVGLVGGKKGLSSNKGKTSDEF